MIIWPISLLISLLFTKTPLPIPVPIVKTTKLFLFLAVPNLFSAKTAQSASLATLVFILNLISMIFFRLVFLNGRLGVAIIISFLASKGPGHPTPIPRISCFFIPLISSSIL